MFVRVLKTGLENGFEEHGGLEGKEDLVRRLLGSPALVKTLRSVERGVAVDAYVGALRTIFLAGAGLAACMVLVQAATGTESGVVEKGGRESERTSLAGEEEDEWEEGMERGA